MPKIPSHALFEKLYGINDLQIINTKAGVNPGWYILHLKNLSRANDLCKKQNVCFNPVNTYTHGWYKHHLNEEQAKFLLKDNDFELFSIKKKSKLQKIASSDSTIDRFFVEATSDWNCKLPHAKVTKFSPGHYIVRGNISTADLLSDDEVNLITKFPTFELKNRFTNGYLQSGSLSQIYYNGHVSYPRTMHDRGINGKDEIVTVVDTGIDYLNPLFYDPDHEVPIGKPSFEHRKIVEIMPMADSKDAWHGHGSHVCGTAAGNDICENCTTKMYNSVAKDAKIIMIDIGYIHEGGSMSGDFDPDVTTEECEKLGSFINSNSWGADEQCDTMTWIYDYISYKYPNTTFVFASGNSYRGLDLSCPSDSKNVISVGGATATGLSDIQNGYSPVYIENGDGESFSVERCQSFHTTLMSYMLCESFRPIYQKPISSDTSDVKDKVFIAQNSQWCADAKTAQNNGAVAVIAFENQYCHESIDIPHFYVSADKKESILKWQNLTLSPKSNDPARAFSKAGFTSYGPTKFHSIKPDVTVPGQGIYSAAAGDPNNNNPRSSNQDALLSKSGTSMATPAVSAMVAAIRQYFREGHYLNTKINTTSYLNRALLINAARPMGNSASTAPTQQTGFGMPTLNNILTFGEFGVRIKSDSIGNKAMKSYSINVKNQEDDLIVSMSYLDPPMSKGHTEPLYADLDLIVVSPSGIVYQGNEWTDSFNTNERIYIKKSDIEVGEYTIVIMSNAFGFDWGDIDYAIVVRGPFDNSDVQSNPVFLPYSNTKIPNIKIEHGSMTENGAVCENGYTGMLCQFQFVPVTSSTIDTSLSYNEVYYFNITLENVTSRNPVISATPQRGVQVHIALNNEPFQDIMDEGNLHHSVEDNGFQLPINVDPTDTNLYGALFLTCDGTKKAQLKISYKDIIRTPTPGPTLTPMPSQSRNTDPISGDSSEDESDAPIGMYLAFGLGFVAVLVFVGIALFCRRSSSKPKYVEENSDEILRGLNDDVSVQI